MSWPVVTYVPSKIRNAIIAGLPIALSKISLLEFIVKEVENL